MRGDEVMDSLTGLIWCRSANLAEVVASASFTVCILLLGNAIFAVINRLMLEGKKSSQKARPDVQRRRL